MKKSVALLLLPILLLFGCSTNPNQLTQSDKPVVYTSVYPVYDLTQKIGGDKIEVVCLVPSGSDAHDYEPSAKDLADMQQADAFFYNGLGMEPFLSNLESNVEIPFYQIADDEDLLNMAGGHRHGDEDDDHEEDTNHDHNEDEADHDHDEATDPHVWLSPIRAKLELENIKDALIEIDPDNADYYQGNFNDYAQKCDELDELYQNLTNQSYVMTHNAYSYLSKDYGFTVYAVDNDGSSDPSAARIKEVVEYCKKNNIKTIYYELGESNKVAQSIANEAGLELKSLNAFESLIDGNSDYFEVMEQNYQALSGE